MSSRHFETAITFLEFYLKRSLYKNTLPGYFVKDRSDGESGRQNEFNMLQTLHLWILGAGLLFITVTFAQPKEGMY